MACPSLTTLFTGVGFGKETSYLTGILAIVDGLRIASRGKSPEAQWLQAWTLTTYVGDEHAFVLDILRLCYRLRINAENAGPIGRRLGIAVRAMTSSSMAVGPRKGG